MLCDELGVHKETLNLWLLKSYQAELKLCMFSSDQIKIIIISSSFLNFQADLLHQLHFSCPHKTLILERTGAPYIQT